MVTVSDLVANLNASAPPSVALAPGFTPLTKDSTPEDVAGLRSTIPGVLQGTAAESEISALVASGMTPEQAAALVGQGLFGGDFFQSGGGGFGGGGGGGFGGGGVGGGGLNPFTIPQGAAFIQPILALLGQLFGFQQSERESQRGASLNAALALANIRAQGPLNAAELLFAREGLGFPAQGGESPIVQLLGGATAGAGGSSALNIGGNRFTLPTTLSGSQLAGLQGNPNAAGVIQSFATAAQEGQNPDIFQRSISALVPSGFGGVGSGLG